MSSPANPTIDAGFIPKLRGLFEPHRFKVLHGGRGSMKSWAVARYLLIQASDHHERVLCGRELQKSIAESVHKLLCVQIEKLGLGDYFEIQNNGIYGPHGSEFIFEGIRGNVDKVKSMEGITKFWGEEADSFSEDSLDIIIPTIRQPGSELIFTYNPHRDTDPIHKMFVLDEPPPGAWVQELNWRDNPYFPEELRADMEHCRRTNPLKYEWIWEGKCRVSSTTALWSWEAIDGPRCPRGAQPPKLSRVVVAIDPAVTANKKSDETGIIVAGAVAGRPQHYYILGDISGRYSPDTWARKALEAYDLAEADAIVYEVNQGGDMVTETLRNACAALGRPVPKLIPVRATRGKALRAEPVAALYEQGLVHHVGHFPDLERQMLTFDPSDPNGKSPDRVDALAWGLTSLGISRPPLKMAPGAVSMAQAPRPRISFNRP